MTKAELIKVLETMNDTDEVVFIERGYDRDGWATESANNHIIRVESNATYTARMNAQEKVKLTKWIDEEYALMERITAEMIADNKPTKAAEKRNANRKRMLAESAESIERWTERMARL